jgi:ParB-like chromosome segregation protein Spo0J|nr:MAG TPA: Putative modification methylase [Caudoviricetes sp.]
MEIERLKINDLLEYKYNAKEHPEWQIEQIVNSIKQFGFNDPIAVDENNTIIEGHGRLYALQEMGETEVDCIRLSHLDEEQKRAYILAHNKLTMNTDFDLDLLQLELDNIIDIDMSDFGFTIDEEVESLKDKIKENDYAGSIIDDFIIMPQTIFDTRQGHWQDRKKQWIELGIKSELGRAEDLTFAKQLQSSGLGGTSIFDPTLCEICYKWFTPHENAKIIDPFAGGGGKRYCC